MEIADLQRFKETMDTETSRDNPIITQGLSTMPGNRPKPRSDIPVFRPEPRPQMAMAPQSGQMPVAQPPRPQMPPVSREMTEEEFTSGFSKMLHTLAPDIVEILFRKGGGNPETIAEEATPKNIMPGLIENAFRDSQGLLPRTASRGGLIEMAMGGDFRGRVSGDGHGMEDNVFMPIQEGPKQVGTLAVSPKEYVVDAHTMSALGNGNADKGADVMDKVVENVRHQAYGTIKQPREINGLAALRPMTERV